MPRLLISLLWAAAALAAGPADEIRALLTRQAQDWNRGDVRAFMEGYERSAATTFVGSSITKGYDAVLARYLKNYSTKAKMGTLRFSDIEVRMLDENYATAVGRFHLERAQADGGNTGGIFTLLFRRTAGGWKIIQDHTS